MYFNEFQWIVMDCNGFGCNSDVFKCILMDSDGYLWISTNSDLSEWIAMYLDVIPMDTDGFRWIIMYLDVIPMDSNAL